MSDKAFFVDILERTFVIKDAPHPEEVLNRVADGLEKNGRYRWQQMRWINALQEIGHLNTLKAQFEDCGTTYCQAGFAIAPYVERIEQLEGNVSEFNFEFFIPKAARALMGINNTLGAILFSGAWPDRVAVGMSPAMADVKDELIGLLDWRTSDDQGDGDRAFTVEVLRNLSRLARGLDEELDENDLIVAIEEALSD